MRVVLWDTRTLDASKDFAGGFGVGKYPGGPRLRDKLIRYFFTRDRRPVALVFAHLVAIFRQLGHEVAYSEDRIPAGADLYVFCPSLITLDLERRAMARTLAENPILSAGGDRVLGPGRGHGVRAARTGPASA